MNDPCITCEECECNIQSLPECFSGCLLIENTDARFAVFDKNNGARMVVELPYPVIATVDVSPTVNINVAGQPISTDVFDGISFPNGTVLTINATEQNDTSENGIYVATIGGIGGWVRPAPTVFPAYWVNAVVHVEQGDTRANTNWLQTLTLAQIEAPPNEFYLEFEPYTLCAGVDFGVVGFNKEFFNEQAGLIKLSVLDADGVETLITNECGEETATCVMLEFKKNFPDQDEITVKWIDCVES